MPKRFQNVTQDFRAGVLSPRYSANVTSEAFAHSLEEGKNVIISSQGGAVFREGMEYISYCATQSPFRLFQFRRGGDVSDMILEVNAGQTRYWVENESGDIELLVDNITVLVDEDSGDFLTDEDGNFLTLGTIITANPYILEELDALYFTNQDTYGILCHENHPPYYTTLNTDQTLESIEFPAERIPEYVYNDYKSPQLVSENGQWKLSFPSGWAVNGLIFYTTYNGVSSDGTFTFDPTSDVGNAANIKTQLDNAAAKQGYSCVFTVTPIDLLNYDISVTGADSGYDIIINPVMIYAYLPTALPPLTQATGGGSTDPVAEPAWSYPMMREIDSFYYQCIKVHKATADDRPGTGVNWEVYWKLLGAVKPVGYDYQNPNGNMWGIDVIYSPRDRGFPTVPVFHEQRLIFCANKDNPTALYGSALGQYFSFIPGPNDDEPILFVLDSSDTPKIKWARSQRQLILGTSSGEWTINADVTLTATDINAKMQNGNRSYLTMAAQIDTEIFYIEQGQRKLRSTQYNRDYGTFVSSNASLLAEHLISTTGIKRVVESAIPEIMLTMVTNDGRPIWMTYEKDARLLAFTEGITNGTVIDVCSYFSLYENRDYTYYAVHRNGRYNIERMRYPTSKQVSDFTANDVVYMDSWATGVVSGNTISGLQHIEGMTVYVLINDAFQEGTYVVNNGTITLADDYTGMVWAVGLPYQGVTRNFEMSDNFRGTGLGTKRRWNRLTTRLLNSSLPLIDAQRGSDRRPNTPMGTSDNVIAGINDVTQNTTGYQGKGQIEVIQDRPYPMYIEAFFGQYQVEDN